MLLRLLVIGSSQMLQAAKLLYQLSKDSANDAKFRRHGLLSILLDTLRTVIGSSRDTYIHRNSIDRATALTQVCVGARMCYNVMISAHQASASCTCAKASSLLMKQPMQ